MSSRCIVLTALLLSLSPAATESPAADAELQKFLNEVNQHLADLYNKEILASWRQELTGTNDLLALVEQEIATGTLLRYIKSVQPKVAKFKRLQINDINLKRQLSQIPEIGYEALSREDLSLMYAVTSNISDIYRNTKLCSYQVPSQCNLSLMSDVQNIMHASKNVAEIDYYWLEWRRRTGEAAREDFDTFVKLYRKMANLNGYSKASDFWFKDFEETSVEALKLLDKFMQELEPLFLQIHAHVRASLRKIYGPQLIKYGKPYPQNLAEIFIGNSYRKADPVWNIELPYPEVGISNITKGLLRSGLGNTQRSFWNVAEYFRSLGMPQMEHDFWTNNAKAKGNPNDDVDNCWHKVWRYYGLNEINLSYCSSIDEERFFNMFEAISDVYYYKAYHKQPTVFQEEPFPNFSDAFGKFFALAASSPRYLSKLKITDASFQSQEARINRLYVQALQIVFLLPIFYLLDRYRVDVLDDKIMLRNNCAYWELTENFTGAAAPVDRSNADFDAPAKLLMDVGDQYTSQIMSIALQFQLYEHFCKLTGQYQVNDAEHPLDLCDISNQRAVGESILAGMSLGSSRSYKEILKVLIGESELSMKGLLAYFKPLHDWLLLKNQRENVEIGWQTSTTCKK